MEKTEIASKKKGDNDRDNDVTLDTKSTSKKARSLVGVGHGTNGTFRSMFDIPASLKFGALHNV